MSIEKMIDEFRDRPVPWDDVREQRLFRRLQAKRRSKGRSPARLIAGIGVAAAAAMVLGLYVTLDFDDAVSATSKGSITKVPNEPDSSVLDLPGAGRVTMMAGARVSVMERNPTLLQIQQSEGKAQYQITHKPGQRVVVHAAGVEVSVIGTVFTVSIEDEMVQVEVAEGVVRIDDGKRTVPLHAGEEMAVASPNIDKEALAHTADGDVLDPEDGIHRAEKSVRIGSKRSIDVLFNEVDKARNTGDYGRAATLLRQIIARGENRSKKASAQFILGKVERLRGHPKAAAQAFGSCLVLSPRSPLAEDARAEEALSWFAAEKTQRARTAIQSYLHLYPNGIHAKRLRRLVE